MLTVFWNHEGILLTAFQPKGQTINADSCNILRKLSKAIQRKRRDSPEQGSRRLVPTAAAGFQGLVKGWDKCLNVQGVYVQK
jgi:DUF1009 family protein